MKKKSTTVAVVDDHPFMRIGIANGLRSFGCEVNLEAEHGAAYITACKGSALCQIAIVDLLMPVMDGWATIAWIAEHQPGVLPIAMTMDPNPAAVRRALQAGARAVMSKNAGPAEWQHALNAVLATGYHHNDLMRMVLENAPEPGSPEALRKKVMEQLTPMQVKFIMAYTDVDEPSLQQMADREGLKLSTIETHRRDVVEKTGAHTRLSMFRFTKDFGLR